MTKTFKKFSEGTEKLIKCLVPDIILNNQSKSDITITDNNQERFNAQYQLEITLGSIMDTFTPSLRDALIRLRILTNQKTQDLNSIQNILNLFATIMQLALFEFGLNNRINEEFGGEVREIAMNKIVEMGFFACKDEIPAEIATVNSDQILKSVGGSSTTLGAHLLATFIACTDDELSQIFKISPNYVDFVAKLCNLRGHGNKYNTNITQQEIIKLEQQLLSSIKMLEDVLK